MIRRKRQSKIAPASRPAPVIGLALGSGASRGWTHIGVIQALSELGVEPQVVCGASFGALVGAVYAGGQLEALADWALTLRRKNYLRFIDIRMPDGGLVTGDRLMDFLGGFLPDCAVEDLPRAFGTVATDLTTGREVWFREGPLQDAVRASIAFPGLITPYRQGESWLVDGGLVNPVPVSLCRALGAQLVIGVNPYGDRLARFNQRVGDNPRPAEEIAEVLAAANLETSAPARRQRTNRIMAGLRNRAERGPGVMDILVGSLNIMQDRITRSRLAGDPPEVLLTPRVSHIGLLEFDRAREAIAEGRACVERMLPFLKEAVGL